MKPTEIVYSYYYPEVRDAVEGVTHAWSGELLTRNIEPGLDDIHLPVFDAFNNRFGRDVTGLNYFPYRYFTNGSSEAIFHLLAQHSALNPYVPIYQLKGEYQGYAAYAGCFGLAIEELEPDPLYADYTDILPDVEPGLFIISNPSAIDGNILNPDLLEHITSRHRVILDLAYLGMTPPFDLDVSNGNIIAITYSLSKPFGLYYYRCGMCWSQEEIPSLYGHKWFKNALSIEIAKHVLEKVNPYEVQHNYRVSQFISCQQAERDLGIKGIDPSDVWLLGWGKYYGDAAYRRGDSYRYCLTPYYLRRGYRLPYNQRDR